MKWFYSPSRRSFFNDDVHGSRTSLVPDPAWVRPEGDEEAVAPLVEIPNKETAIPEDGVEVTAERHAELFAAQGTGKDIVPGPDGAPINVDLPKMSDEDAMENLRLIRNQKLAETDGLVARHRDEKDLGVAVSLSEADFKKLLGDRQALRDLPATTTDAVQDYQDMVVPGMAKERAAAEK